MIIIKQHESGFVSFAWFVNRFKYFRKYKPVKKESLKPDSDHWVYSGVKRLKATRGLFNESARSVAERSGLKEDYIYRLENGHINVDSLKLGTIKKLAIGYGMPPMNLIEILIK